MEAEGVSLTLSAIGAAPAGLSSNGAAATYTDAYPGVDLRYTADNERTKEELVLKKAPVTAAQASFSYDLSLQGLTPTKKADGSIYRLTNDSARREPP